MRWSISEFLNLIDMRGQCWGFVDMGESAGFRIRTNEHVLFYAMIEGSADVCGIPGQQLALAAGDCAIIFSGGSHVVRTGAGSQLELIEFLDNDEYGDLPHHVTLDGPPTGRLLCGRLKVRWPGGLNARFMPSALKVESKDNTVNLPTMIQKAHGSGAASLLTRAAELILIAGLRDHPQCQSIFRDSNFRDPISRAIQFMERHAHHHWTVEGLATKVGMARSTFAGRFHAEVGKSPMEVLTDVRMRQAAAMLTESELKVAEIGERVGYRSQSAFNRRFESYHNLTPGKLRERHRADYKPSLAGPPEMPETLIDYGGVGRTKATVPAGRANAIMRVALPEALTVK